MLLYTGDIKLFLLKPNSCPGQAPASSCLVTFSRVCFSGRKNGNDIFEPIKKNQIVCTAGRWNIVSPRLNHENQVKSSYNMCFTIQHTVHFFSRKILFNQTRQINGSKKSLWEKNAVIKESYWLERTTMPPPPFHRTRSLVTDPPISKLWKKKEKKVFFLRRSRQVKAWKVLFFFLFL